MIAPVCSNELRSANLRNRLAFQVQSGATSQLGQSNIVETECIGTIACNEVPQQGRLTAGALTGSAGTPEHCAAPTRSTSSASTHPDRQAEDKQQVCFDFTKGSCLRGDTCKYSHDVDLIANVNSQERGICFDHLKGQCHRGVLCRFSHDLSGILAQHKQPQAVPRANRRNAPICYDFAKGQCLRGSACRYSHDLSLIGRQAAEICHDFLRGRCHRGGLCRYAHVIPGQTQGMDAEQTAALTKLVALLQLTMQNPTTQAVQQQLLQELQVQLSRTTVPLANAAGVKAAMAAATPLPAWPNAAPDFQQQLTQLLGSMMQQLNLQQAAQSIIATAAPQLSNKMTDLQSNTLPTATTATSDDFRIHASYIQAANSVLHGAGHPVQQGVAPNGEDGIDMQHWELLQRGVQQHAAEQQGAEGQPAVINPELLYRFREIWGVNANEQQ